MSEQFGFTFETETELLANSVCETEELCPDCDGTTDICSNTTCPKYKAPPEPEQTFLLPEIEEEAKERKQEESEDLPWDEYTSQAQLLFFNQNGRNEYKELLSKAAVVLGTKNATDTIMEALRRATH